MGKVVVGGSCRCMHCFLFISPGRRAGGQRRQVSQIVVDCSSRWTEYMLLLPSRTSQSIFPIARET